MIYLLEEALEVAKNYANDPDSDELLAGSCEMGVVSIEDEKGEYAGEGINIFLPTENTNDAPAFVQVLIADDGDLILDEGLLDEDGKPLDFVGDMLADQVEQAEARIEFLTAVIDALDSNKKRRNKNAKKKYLNAV